MKKTMISVLIGIAVTVSSCHKSTEKVERDFFEQSD
jgi:hypothetical protein